MLPSPQIPREGTGATFPFRWGKQSIEREESSLGPNSMCQPEAVYRQSLEAELPCSSFIRPPLIAEHREGSDDRV